MAACEFSINPFDTAADCMPSITECLEILGRLASQVTEASGDNKGELQASTASGTLGRHLHVVHSWFSLCWRWCMWLAKPLCTVHL